MLDDLAASSRGADASPSDDSSPSTDSMSESNRKTRRNIDISSLIGDVTLLVVEASASFSDGSC
jgi:hypothetical protein